MTAEHSASLGPESAFYDRVWDDFGHLDRVSPAAYHRRRLIRRAVERHASSAESVLDVGCGPGHLLEELGTYLRGARLAGADVSRQTLALARARVADADLFTLDLGSTGFEAEQRARFGQFDLVVCSEVVEHLADDELGVSRLAQFLGPGGYLIVTVPGGKLSRFDVAIGHQRHYRRRELVALLEKGGLEVIAEMAWGFPFQNLYRAAVRVASRAALAGPGRTVSTPRFSRLLGAGYAAFGQAMLPLFFLNLPWLGEQLVAVARRAGDPRPQRP